MLLLKSKPIGRPSRSSSNTNLAALANDLTVDTRRAGCDDKLLKEKPFKTFETTKTVNTEKKTVLESNQIQNMSTESIKIEQSILIQSADASNSFSTLLIQANPLKIESTCLTDVVVKADPIEESIGNVNTEIAHIMTTASVSMEVDTKSHKINEEPNEIELKKRKLKG